MLTSQPRRELLESFFNKTADSLFSLLCIFGIFLPERWTKDWVR
jgi:hypothetical protein